MLFTPMSLNPILAIFFGRLSFCLRFNETFETNSWEATNVKSEVSASKGASGSYGIIEAH